MSSGLYIPSDHMGDSANELDTWADECRYLADSNQNASGTHPIIAFLCGAAFAYQHAANDVRRDRFRAEEFELGDR